MRFQNTWKTRGICFALSYVVYYFMRDYVNQILFKLLFNDIIWNLTNNLVVDVIIFFMGLMIPINLFHELIHGIVYRLFGGKVKYEFKGIYINAREISSISIHRSKFLLVLIAPLTVISLLSMLIPGWVGGMILLLNIFKSTGDILKIFYILKGNSNTYIVNKKDGFEIVGEAAGVQLTFDNLEN
ncbi:DUF3267 domain-containing protein [Clostridium thermarum]|uniref:DUF3267 domain-containing protein n=1 Tax=Clostridium thermarum TaxID=1716543 RepID=UPI0013D1C665|nr:DUF3267 domain-containing protein [Clostridium thermarum]